MCTHQRLGNRILIVACMAVSCQCYVTRPLQLRPANGSGRHAWGLIKSRFSGLALLCSHEPFDGTQNHMARLQRSARSQPARFDPEQNKPDCKKSGDSILSVNATLNVLCAGLAISLLSGSANADMTTIALTEGTYLSAEQPTYSPAQTVTNPPVAALPDPASFFLQADSTSENDFGHVPWLNDVAWITGIGTLLYHDSDNDGYHSGFSLTVDADTSRNITDVYVSIDLQGYYGRRERLHTSRIFSLYGRTLTDEYQIDIDLLQQYPADEYDLTIELHDAYDSRVLDRVGASDFSNLSALPLESEDLDYIHDPRPVQSSYLPVNDDIYVEEYAGTTGFLTTLCLSLALWSRRKRRGGS